MTKQLKKSKSTSEMRKETGLFHYSNGDFYEGEYLVKLKQKQIERNGNGSYTTWDGQVYTGHWINDILSNDVDVKINFADQSSYFGTVSLGLQYVHGEYTFPNESKIIGDFKNNTPVASGTEFIDKTSKKWDMTMNENELILKSPNNFFDYIPTASLESSSDEEDENVENDEDETVLQDNDKPK